MKILCLGNNTEDTDNKTTVLATAAQSTNYGLLSELEQPLEIPTNSGYYHTSVYDIDYGRLVDLAREFDSVIVLDQPVEQYSHPDAFYKTIRVATEIKEFCSVTFLSESQSNGITFFEDLVKTNKSFCIFPFIELMSANGSTRVCCRSTVDLTPLSDLGSFKDNPAYTNIRNKMLAGEKVQPHCNQCYQIEERGIASARMQETVEWANRLNLTNLDDLAKIEKPAYYEVRPSNVCNLQCRSCYPASSNSIAREYVKLNWPVKEYSEYADFDIIDFTNLKKLYVAGGEPTAIIEFYDFLDRCIKAKQTDYEMLVNTNATKVNSRFKQQLKHFSNLQFIISIDGFDRLNHYIRWPSDWQTIVENTHYLNNHGHKISFNTTVSIYNVAFLDQLFEFFDREFPGVLVHASFAETPENRLSALHYPDPQAVLISLERVTKMQCYKNDWLLKSFINGLIAHYQNNYRYDPVLLSKFFAYNQALDQSRDIDLENYLPELAKYKQLL